MMRLQRFAPLTGVLAVVLWVLAVIVLETSDSPADKAPGAEIAAWMDSSSTEILLTATLLGIGSAAFIWFLGSVAEHFRADGETRLATIVLTSGAIAAALFACLAAPLAAGALAGENYGRSLSPEAAETMWLLGDGFFIMAEFIAVGFAASAAVALIRGKSSPSWLGWLTALLAVVLAIGFVGWAGMIFGIPLWTLGVSIWLFVRAGRTGELVAT